MELGLLGYVLAVGVVFQLAIVGGVIGYAKIKLNDADDYCDEMDLELDLD